jgi:glucose/arabinose dehydrogenase
MLTKKGVFGIAMGHQNRHLAVDPKTGALYVGVGSSGNLGVEPEPKATIQRFDADGSNQTTVASGTRNATALAFHPQTGELWAVVQERDGLGDDLPSDYLIRVQQGGFYGWPYAYIGKHPQPGFANLAPGKVEATITPDLLFQAHSSLLDLAFYDADQFPSEYKGSLFVALKGSWNRSIPTGCKVVRVPFRDGRPEGYYENFATGFWVSGEDSAEVWGRPAALAVAKDGSLLIRRHRRHDLASLLQQGRRTRGCVVIQIGVWSERGHFRSRRRSKATIRWDFQILAITSPER